MSCLWRYIAYKHARRTNMFQARTLEVVPHTSTSDLNDLHVCTRLSAFRQTFTSTCIYPAVEACNYSSALKRSSSLFTICRCKVVFSHQQPTSHQASLRLFLSQNRLVPGSDTPDITYSSRYTVVALCGTKLRFD